jgi:DNA modification methylase
MSRTPEVAVKRHYAVLNVEQAREIAHRWLAGHELERAVRFGLPEVDDRYHVWRLPLVSADSGHPVGEIVLDAYTTLVLEDKSTTPEMVVRRLLHRDAPLDRQIGARNGRVRLSSLRNVIGCGDSAELLQDFPAGSVDLVFTSPPYYNARPEYTDYLSYEDYLLSIRKVIQQAHRVLGEGRMFVMNVSPVLVRRQSRNHSSRRIAVPFDMHRLFIEEGFEFIDDIHWVKPEGAGWATGRGRRFAADRNPMQYKPVPVTEYVLVYRKATDKLIDWHIRAHPDQALVEASRIDDDYERTNLWKILPAHSSKHPAIFPLELAERVIRYYSFRKDVVLDPFAGIGTTGAAAVKLDRRFVLLEIEPQYVDVIREEALRWLGKDAGSVLCVNCPPIDTSGVIC